MHLAREQSARCMWRLGLGASMPRRPQHGEQPIPAPSPRGRHGPWYAHWASAAPGESNERSSAFRPGSCNIKKTPAIMMEGTRAVADKSSKSKEASSSRTSTVTVTWPTARSVARLMHNVLHKRAVTSGTITVRAVSWLGAASRSRTGSVTMTAVQQISQPGPPLEQKIT